jgi:flagellar protein FliO/FliZ
MDTLFLALRVVVSLGAVLAAIWFLRKWVTKGGRQGAARGRHVEVLARASLGPKSSVALIRAGDKQYLLGVTEHAITILDTPEVAAEPAAAALLPSIPRDFDRALQAAESEVAHIEATPSGAITLHPATRRAMREREAEQQRRATSHATTAAAARSEALSAPAISRRDLREGETQRRSPIAGSILSASTWKQTAQALRRAQ